MRIVELRAQHARNLVPLACSTDARFVVFHGANGQGKTNLLETVWALSTLRPLRGAGWREVVAWGETQAELGATVLHQRENRKLRLSVGASVRHVQLDDHVVHDVAEYFDVVRAIMLLPSDAEILYGAPLARRRWLDRAAFTARPTHLARVQTVIRLLRHKNAVLKQSRPDRDLLDALDRQLAHHAARLVQARAEILAELAPFVLDVHAQIAGGIGDLTLELRTRGAGDSVQEREAAWLAAFIAARESEIQRQRTLVGPQHDEVVIKLDGRAARTFASRGQIRSIVLALKLAELIAAHARGDEPLFVLDELSSELDRVRTEQLIRILAALPTQVWITTTDPEQLTRFAATDSLFFRVLDGVVEPSVRPS